MNMSSDREAFFIHPLFATGLYDATVTLGKK